MTSRRESGQVWRSLPVTYPDAHYPAEYREFDKIMVPTRRSSLRPPVAR
jgi:hypothetical protein